MTVASAGGGATPSTRGVGDRFGSLLWSVEGPITVTTLRQTQDRVTDALAWMVRDGLASSVSCVATEERPGTIRLEIKIDGAVAAVLRGP